MTRVCEVLFLLIWIIPKEKARSLASCLLSGAAWEICLFVLVLKKFLLGQMIIF